MRSLFFVLSFFLVLSVQAFEQKPSLPGVPPTEQKAALSFSLDGIQVSQVLRVVFSEVVKTPYVLDP